MSAATFSKDLPNKIGRGIKASGKNALIKTNDGWRVAIAEESIDAKVNGKKMFCVRVDAGGLYMMVGFTPRETFDSKKEAFFGDNGFTGCGIYFFDGNLLYPVNKRHNIIDRDISKAKEIIVILTISNNGKKKKIRFLCDGNESESSDVSEYLKEDFLFPAICLYTVGQQITTIPIDQIKTRTPEIENLIKEYQQQQNRLLREIELNEERNKQNEEMMSDFFKQFEQQVNVSNVVETKRENKKEKKVKQVATKKTKKETKPKTTKATKKKEETKNSKKEKKTKAKT